MKCYRTQKNRFAPSSWLVFILVCLHLLSGCASYMHGYTRSRALDRYLLVDQSTETFGYKRMQYNLGYNSSLKGFVKEHGLPDFIYEYRNADNRDSIRLYYVSKNIVYIFESRSWLADSLYLKDHRNLTDYERATYAELKKNRL